MRGVGLGNCPGPLAAGYDAGLYDLDGVLYLGTEPVPHAAASVAAARLLGLRPAFVTNNSSRSPAAVAAQLTGLGVPAEAVDVVTSAQVAVRALSRLLPGEPGAQVLVLGTEDLAQMVREGGFTPVRVAGPQVRGVIQGLAPDTSWTDLAEASVALRAGAVWVAGNRDSTFPSVRGSLPGNGALVAALELTTGLRPLVVGKPEPALLRESVERVGARRPLVVGDRLDTDIIGAVRAGVDSLLVLTGVVDLSELLAAPVGSRPTFVGADLQALLGPQPAVLVAGGEGRCGAATASFRADGWHCTGTGTELLRAVCALTWAGGLPAAARNGVGLPASLAR